MTKQEREFAKSRIEYLLKISRLDEHDNEALKLAIQALSQEPTTTTNNNEPITIIYPTIVCDDAVSREAVIDLIEQAVGDKNVTIGDFTFGKSLMLHHINELPPVTQKSGKWINDKNDIPICSRCGYIPQYDRAIDDYEYSNYCPSCGARMVEPQESEDRK